MPLLFNESPSYLLTSESVTEGHPDKLCDQISDAVIDAVMTDDPMGRVACETAMTNGLVMVIGEITTKANLNIPEIVRETLRKAGYTNSDYGIDADSCGVSVSVGKQSTDIDAGVSNAIETREDGDADQSTGAGDQGMMVGFACNETEELMPLTVSLSHRLVRQLAEVRKDGTLPYLRPDGKSQVTVEYEGNKPIRIDAVVVSSQHSESVATEQIREDISTRIIQKIVPAELMDENTKIFVNPTGRFVTGGPHGDAGVTGRKIIVDTYGGMAPHGGGAFSGKDPTKVDRSASYMARYIAKNCVAGGLAERVQVQLAYAIGVADPVSVLVETFGTAGIEEHRISDLVREHFDLTPKGIIESLDLRRPIYRKTAAFGHFGRTEPEFSWENTDKADTLRAAAGL